MSDMQSGESKIVQTLIVFSKSFWATLKEQFSNQAVSGSLALGGAAIISQWGWTVAKMTKDYLYSIFFTVYIIPPSTPQYRYMMAWLKSQPQSKTNVMEICMGKSATTGGLRARRGGAFGGGYGGGQGFGRRNDDDDEESDNYTDLTIIPSLGSTFHLTYHNTVLWISLGKGSVESKSNNGPIPFHMNRDTIDDSSSYPSITVMGKDTSVIRALIREGRKMVTEKANSSTSIFTSVHRNIFEWELSAMRPARKLSSIVLPGTQAEDIARDCREFLDSEPWYSDRGIPYRRGYLLHGKPGCGKTSLVTALAGQLKLNVYIVSLASPGMDDDGLLQLLNAAPPHTILLMEDIDAVFETATTESSLSQEEVEKAAADEKAEADEAAAAATAGTSENPFGAVLNPFGGFSEQGEDNLVGRRRGCGGRGGRGSYRSSRGGSNPMHTRQMKAGTHRLTFAGILNALDGIAGQTGRMVFMSTNHKERLDPALIRPGRVDYEIEFAAATRDQCKQLFINFYQRLSGRDEYLPNNGINNINSRQTVSNAQPLSPIDAAELVDGSPSDEEHISVLAERFANAIPENKHTMSQIQGICMGYRGDPEGVVQHVEAVQRKTIGVAAEAAVDQKISDYSSSTSKNLAENGDDDATDSNPLFSTAVKLPSLSRQLSGGGGSSTSTSRQVSSSNDDSSGLAAFGGGSIEPSIVGPTV